MRPPLERQILIEKPGLKESRAAVFSGKPIEVRS
jgi:hypothetical protein